jgi:uncharacterized integral membrane protein
VTFTDSIKFWLGAWVAKFVLGVAALVVVAVVGGLAWLGMVIADRVERARKKRKGAK